MTYSQFGCCGNHQISAKYVMDNLVMCENRVNTHTFSSRVFYRKYLKCQRVSNSFLHNFGCGSALLEQVPYCVHLAPNFSGFANRFLRLISTQWCSAPPCGGCRSIASSYYGVIGRHSSCLFRNVVFSYKPLTSKNERYEGRKKML